jgi:hypothetical protein
MKRLGITVTVILVVAVLGFVGWAYVRIGHTVPAATTSPAVSITVEGVIACLPNKDSSGPHTLECAIGLVDGDGHYYGLRNMSQPDMPNGTRVRVRGTKQAPEASGRYDIRGVINVQNVAKLE